jgi:Methyltransferase domain
MTLNAAGALPQPGAPGNRRIIQPRELYGAAAYMVAGGEEPHRGDWFAYDIDRDAAILERVLFYGPYIGLEAGVYSITLNGGLDGALTLRFTHHVGKSLIEERTIDTFGTPLCLTVTEPVDGFEVVGIRTDQLRSMRLDSIFVDRIGPVEANAPVAAVSNPVGHVADYPALTREHVAGAHLFADRKDLILSLPIPQGGIIAEVGVARGDFSEFLLAQCRPRKFVAFDSFTLDQESTVWGTDPAVYFNGLSHLEYYKRRFASWGNTVIVEAGLSHTGLARYSQREFDLIYIDAGHDYESVKRDTDLSTRLVKDTGVLVFNDYTMYDHFTNSQYGVVPAVNELIVHQGWRVAGFALEKNMFCDIALSRDGRSGRR